MEQVCKWEESRGSSKQMKARFIEPMLCLAVTELPEGPEWIYELKLDGYRGIGLNADGRARLLSRNGKDLSDRFPGTTKALQNLPDETIIDGEIVALDDDGRPSFSILQNSRDCTIVFYAFDLLLLAGLDMRRYRLESRREVLRTRVLPQLSEPIRFSETFDGPPATLVRAVREHGLEGVVAKRRDSLYDAGRRSGTWLKMRVNRGQEFVIGGYVPASDNFDSILVGYYEGKELVYVTRVRNGFTPALRVSVFKRFRGLGIERCPFANLPEKKRQVGRRSDRRGNGKINWNMVWQAPRLGQPGKVEKVAPAQERLKRCRSWKVVGWPDRRADSAVHTDPAGAAVVMVPNSARYKWNLAVPSIYRAGNNRVVVQSIGPRRERFPQSLVRSPSLWPKRVGS